ncbi:nitrate- and nitrite sensing domain-containing protein [Streptomyces sp. ST2-7A]|uniref:sensor histidine kinase n=1 Tax=Streptomyces sp. ST2-7A TaxID=2907214 RepID=UPI001F3637B6|nr:nitrate- and nitrite sensing domain-containing protein [Streptomyces sp. ST2-7A]MCE7081830.1 nitrate- and nitrite sensing domain-containing protein [Streptomyces sp. ST2-7A]
MRPPSPHSIRGRVVLVLAVPTCLLLVLVGVGVADHADRWSAAGRGADRVELSLDVQRLVRELQREHGLGTGLAVGAGRYRPELADTRRRVDGLRRTVGRSVEDAGPDAAPAVRSALDALNRLPAVRDRIDNGVAGADGPAYFSETIAGLNRALAEDRPARDDRSPTTGLESLDALSQASEALSVERSVLTAVLVAGRFEPADHLAFVEARGARVTALASLDRVADPAVRAATEEVLDAPTGLRLAGLEEELAASVDGGAVTVDPEEWWSTSTAVVDGLHAVQADAADAVALRADGLRADAGRRLVGFLSLGLLVIGAAVLFSALAARSITRPLIRLAREAEDLAERRLPEAVRAVREAEPEEGRHLLSGPPGGPDAAARGERGEPEEIGQLAAALHRVEHTALGLAAEQAVLRRNGTESLAHLGRRNQQLLHRQLRLITALESKELDPDALGELFQLDHLATRMRRNADSLLLLAGEQSPPRVWNGTVSVAEVVHSAISEVEEYRRVALVEAAPCLVHGRWVAELSHLLAELIENALTASPPSRPVEVYGWWDGAEYCLVVLDRGTGMSDSELEVANDRLSGTTEFLGTPTRRLGHFVVGALAARMDARVEVRHTQADAPAGTGHGGGVTAWISLPRRMLVAADVPTGAGGYAEPGEPGYGEAPGPPPVTGANDPANVLHHPDRSRSGDRPAPTAAGRFDGTGRGGPGTHRAPDAGVSRRATPHHPPTPEAV